MVRPQVTDRKPRDRGPPSHAFTIQEFCDAHRFSRAHYYNLKRSAGAPTRPRSAIASSSRSNWPNARASSTPQLASDPHPTTPPRKRREGAPSGYPGALSLRNLSKQDGNAHVYTPRPSRSPHPGIYPPTLRNPVVAPSSNARQTDRATLSAAPGASNSTSGQFAWSAKGQCARRLRNSAFAAIGAVRHFAAIPSSFGAVLPRPVPP